MKASDESAGPPPPDHSRVQRRTVRTLVVAEVVSGSGIATGFAVTSLLAEDIGGSATLAGLSQTAATLGGAVAAGAVAALTHVRGRRPGLAAGYLVAAVGAVVCTVSAVQRDFALFLVGMVLYGAAGATGLQARFAAADLAAPQQRGKAMSLVLTTTVVGAVVGPNLTGPGAELARSVGLPPLSGTFLFAMVGFGIAFAAIAVFLRPDPLLLARGEDTETGERVKPPPLREMLGALRGNGPAVLAILAIVAGHLVMIAVMAMTGIHMHHAQVGLGVIGMVLSGHLAGMYGFSTLFGWLVDKYGSRPVLYGGLAGMLLSLWISGSADGADVAQLAVGLALLGLTWSAVLVAASVLLSESVDLAARPAAQGFSDMAMNIAAAGGAAFSGVVLERFGFGTLTMISAFVLLLPLFALPAVRRSAASRRAVPSADRPS
ncbi:MFS transporter [Streptomyces nitrosporeus]|uniref:MFS transporter n=1 Tax=Streptomyces nitrosporeus TaxID=28894 RepID=A0A5J6FGV5_9ACTN|nr:MFS transporter [Streptomyces nitrosporeus]QEU75256.1 MFS transporter [Streptomyces nitrosporeus]GGZ18981.1 putative MFS-type transporter YddS [Streptomyces nitrosporeus]